MTHELESEKNHNKEAVTTQPLSKLDAPSAIKNPGALPSPSESTCALNGKAVSIEESLASPEELLKAIKGFYMGYTLDCFGCCTMPAVFQIHSADSTSTSIGVGDACFECTLSLPTFCDSVTSDTFVVKSLASQHMKGGQFIKVKIGLHGKGWCASKDKIDVYLMKGPKETHLGYAFKESKCCGYKWQINTPDNTPRYVIENDKSRIASCCRYPCGCCKQIEFQIKDQSGKNEEEKATISKVINDTPIKHRIGLVVATR